MIGHKYDYTLDMNDPMLQFLLMQIEPQSTVLEFGPAMGRFTKYLKNELKCRVFIVEIDESGYQSAIQFAEKGVLGDITTANWDKDFSDISFDYILFLDVLEHLPSPEKSLARVLPLMKEDGKVFLSLPNIAYAGVTASLVHGVFRYRSTGILDDTHVRFFTYDNIVSMLNEAGLAPVVLRGYLNDLAHSEFTEEINSISPVLAEMLQDTPSGLVYEWFAIAVKQNYFEDNKTSLDTDFYNEEATLFTSYLYYDTGHGYNDEEVLVSTLQAGEHQSVHFRLSQDLHVKSFRWLPTIWRLYHCQDVVMVYSGDQINPAQDDSDFKLNDYTFFLHPHGGYVFPVNKTISSDIQIKYSLTIDYLPANWIQNIKFLAQRSDVSHNILFSLVADFSTALSTKNASAMELQNQQQHLQQHIKTLEMTLTSITESRVWKATWPVRYVFSKIHALFERSITTPAPEPVVNICLPEKPLILTPPRDVEPTAIDEKVSFIIPAYNGGIELDNLLKMLNVQKGLGSIEIIVVDSESSDDTRERAEFLGAKVVTICKKDFSHSYSRNIGAKNATGEYLIFTTQDAMPTSLWWARRLLEPIINCQVVAASLMEEPRPNAELYYRLGIWRHHVQFLGLDGCDRIGFLPPEQNHVTLRQNANLNDGACAHRRSIFMQYHYQGVFGEDLDYGLRVIRDGHKIGLLSSEKVIHSHNRQPYYYLKRSFVEYSCFSKMLPDMPLPQSNKNELVATAVKGYCEWHLIRELLLGMFPTDPISADTFFTQTDTLFKGLSFLKSLPLERPSPSGDNAFDSVLNQLWTLHETLHSTTDVSMLPTFQVYMQDVAEYFKWINQSMVAYSDREAIADALLKHFSVCLGATIYACCVEHPEEKDIIALGDSLNSGV